MSNRLGWVWCALTCLFAAGLVASCGDSKKNERPAAAAGEAGTAPAAGGNAGEGGMSSADAGASAVTPPAIPKLGLPCITGAACGPGLSCLSADDDFRGVSGGPAGGLCTTDCSTDAECRAFDARAVCGTVGEIPLTNAFPTKVIPRVCLLGCELGPRDGMPKCQGRADLACRPFAGPDSVECMEDKGCPSGSVCYRTRCRELACGPRCNDDDNCERGRFCDPVSGLCTDKKPEPVPWGRECNDLPNSPGCGGGNCLVLFGVVDGSGGEGGGGNAGSEGGASPGPTRLKGMCTQTCTLGQACGEGAGACVQARSPAFGAGDAGYCSPLCSCDSDCVNPVDRCIAWTDPAYEEAFGSPGRCDYPWPGSRTLDCSDAGGAGGAGGARN